MNLNEVKLIGNAGKDADTIITASGKSVTKFSLCTDDGYFDKDNNWQSSPNWHSVIAWNKLSEKIASHIKKGHKMFVIGKLTHRTYDDKEGNKRYITEVVATKIAQLVTVNDVSSNYFPKEEPAKLDEALGSHSSLDDDLPF